MEKCKRISEETLTRYVSGTASLEEMAEVAHAMAEDPSIRELVDILERMNANGSLRADTDALPISDCAGVSENNLCDVLCERFILRDFTGIDSSQESEPVSDNVWLKESGMPLHSMGRELERCGMSVSRRFDCTLDDMLACFKDKKRVIAVVDSGELWNGEANGLFHAVVCICITPDVISVYDPVKDRNASIKLYDPSANAKVDYMVGAFLKAWGYSHNYMVTASTKGMEYIPHPIDLSGVSIDEDLMELKEAMAENSHEVWAQRRADDGWTYGRERDDQAKRHPDMLPYADLPESEKDYNRDNAIKTILLVKKLGFDIRRRYTLYCPNCGEFVSEGMKYCPECGKRLSWEEIK